MTWLIPLITVIKPIGEGKVLVRARAVAQWLRALIDLAVDPGSVPSNHMAAHNHL